MLSILASNQKDCADVIFTQSISVKYRIGRANVNPIYRTHRSFSLSVGSVVCESTILAKYSDFSPANQTGGAKPVTTLHRTKTKTLRKFLSRDALRDPDGITGAVVFAVCQVTDMGRGQRRSGFRNVLSVFCFFRALLTRLLFLVVNGRNTNVPIFRY